MAFFGRVTVLADLRLHKEQAGLVTTCVYTPAGSTAGVTFANACPWPSTVDTALGKGGLPVDSGLVTIWRAGETTAPQIDGQLVIAGQTELIVTVDRRFPADEGSNYCVYDCRTQRVP